MTTLLTRDDIIAGLRELIDEFRATSQIVSIRLVGGAALALGYFDRGTTQDLDALYVNPGDQAKVKESVARIAALRGWDRSWLNFAVEKADALPRFGRRTVEWQSIYDDGGVVIQVADEQAMLAMKLRANRPGRDTNDIRQLLRLREIDTLTAAEELYEEFYPGDGLTDRAIGIVERIFEIGLPESVAPPPPAEL